MRTQDLASLPLSPDEAETLSRFGFDLETWSRLQKLLAAGEFPLDRNQLREPIAPPAPSDLTPWPDTGTSAALEDERLGQEALAQGRVAVCVLNGGMATRFGGKVKGVVEVVDGLSFLALKLGDVARAPGRVTTFLMNSFATERDTRDHLEKNSHFGLDPKTVHSLTQRISIRLTPQGDVFKDERGRASLYAPGHGDLFEVLAGSTAFTEFVAHGGKIVLVSNVDNLAATLSPRVIGAHLRAGNAVTVEVAPRAPNDKGGAPARVRGRVEVLEGFRFPPSFDIAQIPVFNTNTMLVDVAAVRADYPLTWFRADKTVDGRQAVQFERLMGEVTAFASSTFLAVPRDGPEGRFMPVKTPEDLITVRPAVRERFGRARKAY
jgi:UTP--glucose-1-phosphate uridylyltransferase